MVPPAARGSMPCSMAKASSGESTGWGSSSEPGASPRSHTTCNRLSKAQLRKPYKGLGVLDLLPQRDQCRFLRKAGIKHAAAPAST